MGDDTDLQLEAVRAALIAQIAAWRRARRSFELFARRYGTKIERKVRGAQTVAALQELAWELELARRVLADPHLTLAYEAGGGRGGRAPDFEIAKGAIVATIEATRVRGADAGRLAATIGEKLTQQRGAAHLLAIQIAAPQPAVSPPAELTAATRDLLARAEAGDSTLFSRTGVADRRAFFAAWRCLSVIAVYGPSERLTIWHNPQAKLPFPPSLLRQLAPDQSETQNG